MGYGDNIMASGMAKGAKARGKRVAFGVQIEPKIIWDHNSEAIFRHNPNVAPPGSERDVDLEWVRFHQGARQYNVHDRVNNRWRWRDSWRGPTPGEIFLDDEELEWLDSLKLPYNFAVIEPNVPSWKTVSQNKQWPIERFRHLASKVNAHLPVIQMVYGERHDLDGVRHVRTKTFRQAVAILSAARFAVLPEGGLHHAAAARIADKNGRTIRDHVPSAVIFGGFIPIRTTGYAVHRNFGQREAGCGNLGKCQHCQETMNEITVDEVLSGVSEWLTGTSTASSAA